MKVCIQKKPRVGDKQTCGVTMMVIANSLQRTNLRVCKEIVAPKVKFRDTQRDLTIKNPVLQEPSIMPKRKWIMQFHPASILKDHPACRQKEFPIKNPVSALRDRSVEWQMNSILKDHSTCRQRELPIKNPVLKQLYLSSKSSKWKSILISQHNRLGENEEVPENLVFSQKNCEIESNTGYIKRP